MKTLYERIKMRKGKWHFALLFTTIGLIFLLGYISPKVIQSTKENWKEERLILVEDIREKAVKVFDEKQATLLSTSIQLKNSLRAILSDAHDNEKIFSILLSNDYANYSISFFNPLGELVGWNELVHFYDENLSNHFYKTGSLFFFNSNLITFLGVVDTLNLEEGIFKIFVGIPLKCEAEFLADKFSIENFDETLSNKFSTNIDFIFEPYKSKYATQTETAFELTNNNSEKIGLMIINYPLLQSEINRLRNTFSSSQSILIVFAYLLLGMSLRRDYKILNSMFVKLLMLMLYLGIGRLILFATNIPNIFLPENLSDPNLFSSKFGEGIVRSPIDFFVTTFFFLLIALQTFSKSRKYFFTEGSENKTNKYFLAFAVVLNSIFLTLSVRAFAAICKSVIFDSTLRYFKEPEIFPPFSHFSMLGTLLLCGVAFLLILLSLLLFTARYFNVKSSNKSDLIYISSISVFTFVGLYFYQYEPLLPIYYYLVFIAMLFLLVKSAATNSRTIFLQFGIYFFVSSFVSTLYLNYFNGEMEKNSLVSTALELKRSNISFYNFLMNESLETLKDDELISSTFLQQADRFHAAGFIALQKLKLSGQTTAYSIYFLDRSKKVVGGFSQGINSTDFFASFFSGIKIDDIIINEVIAPNGEKYLTGLTPVIDRNILLGYLNLTIKIENRLFLKESAPILFAAAIDKPSDVIQPKQLNISLINEGGIEILGGVFVPNREIINQVMRNSFDGSTEYWIESESNDENYLSLAYNISDSNRKEFYLVTIKRNSFTLILFNFFKIFIAHTFLILIFYLIAIIINLKEFLQLFLSFRTKLLAALILISLIPIIALAAYNRIDSSEKITETYKSGLRESVVSIERHIQNQLIRNPERPLETAFHKASEELGTNFSVYDNSDLLFSSYNQYYYATLFPSVLLPSSFVELVIKDGKQFFHTDDKNLHYSFFSKTLINNHEYIFVVDNVFNKIQTAFSPIEVDVFLVGVYSFAIVLILVFSTFISNTISTPIRKLTRATQSVAMGDLNFELKTSDTGEIKNLISGFNYMTNELRKSQQEISQLERENAWREMAKQIAHEIKNPLTPMKLTIQQLMIAYKDKSAKFDSIFEKVSTTILNQIETLNQIASEFSQFARMPSLSLEKINLCQLLGEIKTLYEDEKLSIEITCATENTNINGDLSQTRRMFVNLCRNSLQASADRIMINLFEENNNIIVDVNDNGTGIKSDVQQNIFLHNFTNKASGMGLGLKLAKRYMESIDGSIELLHSENRDTTFRIKFK